MLPLQEMQALTQQLQAASEAADSERQAAAEAAAKSRADMKVNLQPLRPQTQHDSLQHLSPHREPHARAGGFP